MADRGRAGRGRTQRVQPAQPPAQLPHAQAAGGDGIRRPGEPGFPAWGTGRGTQRLGRGDSAAIANLGRGVERLRVQSSGGGDAGEAAAAVEAAPTMVVGRGSCRGKKILSADILKTRPEHIENKKGTSGRSILLKANYFKLVKSTDWSIQQYRVDCAPEEDRTGVRKGLLKLHKKTLGPYIFDGTVMYTCTRLPKEMVFTSMRQSDEKIITITVKLVGELKVGDHAFIQFFNIIMRKCFEHLKLEQVGRDYYDPKNKVVLPDYKLELWPGYVTSIRQHERDILMCAAITYKVMRTETVFDILRAHMRDDPSRFRENFCNAIIGTVVLTSYNNNTYRVEDVDFRTTPKHSFKLKNGEEITYIQYYKTKRNTIIRNLDQPMLVTKSKLRDRQAAAMEETVFLVPELCHATGLTDSMRENFRLMSALSAHTRLHPGKRVEKLMDFHRRLKGEPNIKSELAEWNLQLDNNLLDVPARVLNPETLVVGGNIQIQTPPTANWSSDMQKQRCFMAQNLRDWVIISTERDKACVEPFLLTLRKVSNGIGFPIDHPVHETIRDDRPGTYSERLERILSKRLPQMVFCVVSNNRSDRYSAIKKKCCIDRPIPSQVCLFRTLTHRSIMSIATKIAIQMNCKLGGAPWHVIIPLEGLMVVGFDVCHDTAAKGRDFGATVATLDKNMTKYFSSVDLHRNGEELSAYLACNICKAAKQYQALNKSLPTHILVYRDGVGEGQVPQVRDHEVVKIQQELDKLYGGNTRYKMAFVIVTKRLNTRLFHQNGNPPAGVVVDDHITSPIKYDFFLVSQQVREGTITPTSYSIIHDTFALSPDQLQRLTYKLTYMYFNCTNTVRVPAPCHYAHKLAFLVSKYIHDSPSAMLQNKLYFL